MSLFTVVLEDSWWKQNPAQDGCGALEDFTFNSYIEGEDVPQTIFVVSRFGCWKCWECWNVTLVMWHNSDTQNLWKMMFLEAPMNFRSLIASTYQHTHTWARVKHTVSGCFRKLPLPSLIHKFQKTPTPPTPIPYTNHPPFLKKHPGARTCTRARPTQNRGVRPKQRSETNGKPRQNRCQAMGPVHAPLFPEPKFEEWWIFLVWNLRSEVTCYNLFCWWTNMILRWFWVLSEYHEKL